jgi:hypothetical protein
MRADDRGMDAAEAAATAAGTVKAVGTELTVPPGTGNLTIVAVSFRSSNTAFSLTGGHGAAALRAAE